MKFSEDHSFCVDYSCPVQDKVYHCPIMRSSPDPKTAFETICLIAALI